MIKSIKTLIGIAVITTSLAATAQTTDNTAGPLQPNLLGNLPVVGPPIASNTLILAGTKVVNDAYIQFKNASFKDGFTADTFVLYHKGDYGVGIAVSTIETNAINYGFAIAAVQETDPITKKKSLDFYDTSFNVSYNGDVDLPVLGKAQYFIETGAAVDLKNVGGGVYNQSVAGIEKNWQINDNITFGVWGGMGYLSKWNDGYEIGGIKIIDHLKGKHFLGLF